MENKSLSENLTELNEVVKSYVDARFKYWKVLLLEKATKAGTFVFSTVVLLVLMLSFILFLGLAFSFWYAEQYGSLWIGFLISAGGIAVLTLIVYFLRKTLFTRRILKNISTLLFPEDDE